MNYIKRSFPLNRYMIREDEFIDTDVPAIVTNYKNTNKADKKVTCNGKVSHRNKTNSELSYSELLWKINKYQTEE